MDSPILRLVILTLTYCMSQVKGAALAPGFPFELSYEPVDLVPNLTQNVTLRCQMTPNAAEPFQYVYEIKILKKSSDHNWLRVADIDHIQDTQIHDDVISSACGDLGDATSSYLEVTWDIAVDETFGIYKCVIHGLLGDMTSEEVEETSEIVIKQFPCGGR